MISELLRPGSRVLCAVSGGADSMALLHRLRQREDFSVCAAHYEHGLRGEESLRDAAFVEDYCRARDIPCLVGHGDVKGYARERGLGIEEAARELRYAFLERAADALGCDTIATAHNADDNAETLLLHLLRGSGLDGLRGIPPRRGRIVRPLLDTTRAEIEAYLKENGVPHVEDSSNAADAYSRNLLRHQVMPVLRELNPRVSEAMGRTARLLARDGDCLDRAAAALVHPTKDGSCLLLEELRRQDPAIASRAIRLLWPGTISSERMDAALAFLRSDESGVLELPGGRLRRERGQLFPDRDEPILELPERELPREGRLPIPEAGLCLRVERRIKGEEINGLFKTYDLKCEKIRGKILCTGLREGDRFHPAGRGCGKSLKALFSEAGLTRRERAAVPVLRDEDGILAVLGFGQDERSLAGSGDSIVRIIWTEEAE